MKKRFSHLVAICFTIIFMAMISAPTIITSVDNTIDISAFFGINEEEESEGFKLVLNFDDSNQGYQIKEFNKALTVGYTFKNYPKPHLNLISPPPELSL